MTYTVVTPAHNEEAHLQSLCESLSGQTLRPSRWVIVENGSTDATLAIASELAAGRPWIDVRSIPGSTAPDEGLRSYERSTTASRC